MTKDWAWMFLSSEAETGELDLSSRRLALRAHLESSFYPPLPGKLKESILEAFEDHWDGKLGFDEEFVSRCWPHDEDGILRYFADFLLGIEVEHEIYWMRPPSVPRDEDE